VRIEDKKYVWWGLLGIGVAAFFYFLSSRNKSGATSTNVQVPYLVPTTTGASPSASDSLSNQPNIIGSSPNSTVPNFSNPYGVAGSYAEVPNTWGFLPNLTQSPTNGPFGSVSYGSFNQPPGVIWQNGVKPPGANYTVANNVMWPQGYGPNPGNGQPYIPA